MRDDLDPVAGTFVSELTEQNTSICREVFTDIDTGAVFRFEKLCRGSQNI
jgi:hypothetical protein